MKKYLYIIIVFFVTASIFLYACSPAWTATAAVMKAAKGQKKAAEGKADEKLLLPENLDINEIDSIIAKLSDEQVRRLLLSELKKEALQEMGIPKDVKEVGRLAGFILGLKNNVVFIKERIKFLQAGFGTAPRDLYNAGAGLVSADGKFNALKNFISLIAIFCLSILIDYMFRRKTAVARETLKLSEAPSWKAKAGRRALAALLDFASIAIFSLLTLGMIILFFKTGGPQRTLAVTYLVAFVIVRGVRLITRFFLAPSASTLRLLPLSDDAARYLYKWIIRISIVGSFGWLTCGLLRLQGIGEAPHLLMISIVGLVITLMIIHMISQSRESVARVIRRDLPDSNLRAKFAGVWHRLAIFYVFALWAAWVMTLLLLGPRTVLPAVATLVGFPLFFIFDRAIQGLSVMAFGRANRPDNIQQQADPTIFDTTTQKEDIEKEPHCHEDRPEMTRFNRLLRIILRTLLIVFFFFGLMNLWGIDFHIGKSVAKAAITILVAILISYVSWELINVPIRKKLQEQIPDDEDREEGGKAGSRIGTLLLLFRKFLLAVMVVMVFMIVLSNLGVNIGPLIAGAGVFGLAIGFGAQTLVKDIISGIFFLIDDAFRVGDYVDTGKLKGMVEHISLRSLRLRHPRGMVHTIPFGDIGSVTNFSRDYIIMKLDIPVKYDTDIDQVRKIIKKIDEELSKDPGIAPKLLGKIKSQGIRQMDDSAMTVRIKFKTFPGEQFTIRQQVYQRVLNAFKEKGIPFAHRNVTVYLPAEAGQSPLDHQQNMGSPTEAVDKRLLEAGAAAAIANDVKDDKPKAQLE